jgi:hypothetical protein
VCEVTYDLETGETVHCDVCTVLCETKSVRYSSMIWLVSLERIEEYTKNWFYEGENLLTLDYD